MQPYTVGWAMGMFISSVVDGRHAESMWSPQGQFRHPTEGGQSLHGTMGKKREGKNSGQNEKR